MLNELRKRHWTLILIWSLCVGGIAYYILAFLYITISRIAYPFALEWMEGTTLVQVQRILSGQLLYVKPTLEYVPLIYPPLYYYLSAALTALLGFGFLPSRLVSLLASIGIAVLIYYGVRRRVNSPQVAWISTGFFVATFYVGGSWFDIARVDMLALFFMMLSVHLASLDEPLHLFFAGISITLACLTKQTFFLVEVILCLYFLLFRRGKSLVFISSASASYGLAYFLLNRLHDGWYKTFVYNIPSGHELGLSLTFLASSLGTFLAGSVLKVTPVVFIFSMIYFVLSVRDPDSENFLRSDAFFLLVATGATVGLAWAGLVNPGSFLNVVTPAYAMLTIIAGLGLDNLLNRDRRDLISGILGVLSILQFILLYYPVSSQIPTRDDLDAGMSLIEEIKSQPGNVYVPYHPELALFAGKPAFASWISLLEISGSFGGQALDEWYPVSKKLGLAFKHNDFDLVILDHEGFFSHPEEFYSYSSEISYINEKVFYPVTGAPFRPLLKYYVIGP